MADTPASGETEAFVALTRLVAEYWAGVDRLAGATGDCAGFFTIDATMTLGTLVVSGRDALARFFSEREAGEIAKQRTTRHVVSNARLEMRGEGRATLRTLVQVFAGIGERPLPAEAPSGLGDFTYACVRAPDGRWLFEAISAESIFAGEAAPAFAKRQA